MEGQTYKNLDSLWEVLADVGVLQKVVGSASGLPLELLDACDQSPHHLIIAPMYHIVDKNRAPADEEECEKNDRDSNNSSDDGHCATIVR